MPVVGIVLALLSGTALCVWQVTMLHGAGALALAGPLGHSGPPRDATEAIDDPALAAAIFFFALGRTSTDDPAAIRARIQRQIAGVAPGAGDELMHYAEWASHSVADPKDCIRRFKPLWLHRLDRAQRGDFIAMAEAVVRHGGIIESSQKITLAALRLSLA